MKRGNNKNKLCIITKVNYVGDGGITLRYLDFSDLYEVAGKHYLLVQGGGKKVLTIWFDNNKVIVQHAMGDIPIETYPTCIEFDMS